MTANRYKRPSQKRTLDYVTEMAKASTYGNARPTFLAAIHDNDLTNPITNRDPFSSLTSGGENGLVMWNLWDDNYNRQIFEPEFTTAYSQTWVVGVELLIPGVYLIRAQIDWNSVNFSSTFMNTAFPTWLGSNFDESSTMSYIPWEPTGNMIASLSFTEVRVMWPSFTGAESSVLIVAAHNHPSVTNLYIPGGFGGFWAYCPYLAIIYLGGLEGAPLFFDDVS